MSFLADPDRFLEIFQLDRCPICFLTHDYAHEHIKSLLDESVTDPVSRRVLSRSQGFCRRHAWRAVQQNQILGLAIIYEALLEEGLKSLKNRPRIWGKKAAKRCPICESEQKREQALVLEFCRCWELSEKLRKTFAERGILCLSHLKNALAQKMDGTLRQSLFEKGNSALEKLLKDLNEFLEKQDYHRSRETVGQERDAWIRAIRMVSGERE
jgi:hypothetical protein